MGTSDAESTELQYRLFVAKMLLPKSIQNQPVNFPFHGSGEAFSMSADRAGRVRIIMLKGVVEPQITPIHNSRIERLFLCLNFAGDP